MTDRTFAAVLMGSDSDLPIMGEAVAILDRFEIPREVRVSSAHRTPEATRAYVVDAEARGCGVFTTVVRWDASRCSPA